MSLGTPVFTKINEHFVCSHCGHEVPPASQTCRDHCPKCLHSCHVDVLPGDRQANCAGVLVPKSYSHHKKKGWMIHYVCSSCGAARDNRFLDFDAVEADNYDALLRLSSVSKTKA